MRRIGVLGVPTSIGSHHAGQELAPSAVRAAGLVRTLESLGHRVTDHGDLPARVHTPAPRVHGVRAVDDVLRLLTEVRGAVSRIVESGEVPLVLGGDCTVSLGVLSAMAPLRPQLIYVDGDADLSTPESSGTGVLDSMGISHLLGSGDPRMAALASEAGLTAADIVLFGTNPAELDAAVRGLASDAGLTMVESDEVGRAPAEAAEAVLAALDPERPTVVHVDVDVLDSGSVPLANFPHFGGLEVDALARSLAVIAALEPAAVVLTEVNPTYDPSGRSLAAVVAAFTCLFGARPA